jgi:hypothetical protein
MTDYIKPECMPYFYDKDGDQKHTNRIDNGIAYTSDGYLLPCCWCDAPSTRKDITDLGFYDESLKLSKNESIEDIISTDVWGKFINIIMHQPDKAPKCCREKCGVSNE